MASVPLSEGFDYMKKLLRLALIGIATVTLLSSVVTADPFLDKLTEKQIVASFATECVYQNELGDRVGARFRHVPSGFVLDVLRIQSLPQAFMWFNSTPPSDQGEPHTLEHLLLGKGTKGRYVASLEDMRLGESSAFTMQMQTCYNFNTTAGADVFFELFEAKLDALLHPTYSDEDIRREVRNFGLAQSADGGWRLEEKGTVYNEMVRGFESPWGMMSRQIGQWVWGENHPMSYDAGGYPPAIRTMTPQNLRDFHAANYHLNNMGAVVSIADDVPLDVCLQKLADIFKRVEPNCPKLANADPAIIEDFMPKPKPGPAGSTAITTFPNQNATEPGMIMYAWPPQIACDNREFYLLQLFMDNLASGQTANLYKTFINSQTRKIDPGNISIYSWQDGEPGHSSYVVLDNVRNDFLTEKMIDSLRGLIQSEIQTIAGFADGSPELKEFNQRAQNRIIERRRDLRTFLNTPPGFGQRGSGAAWMQHLKRLEKTGGFTRSLILSDELAFADSLAKLDQNVWKNYVAKWKLTEFKPYGVAAKPDPTLLTQSETDRAKRVDDYIAQLGVKYGDTARADIIAKYKKEYDANTAVIDSVAATIPMPTFVDNPPMTLDDPLQYKVDKLPGGGALVKSTFENMTSATTGLAFNLNTIPESLLVYASALPLFLTDIGVVHNGKAIAYDEMAERIRREIRELNAYFSVNYRKGRVELVVRAAGSDSAEIARSLEWMQSALFESDLRPDNLSRIRDAVDQQLGQLRGTMAGSEESWVQNPVYNYWRQQNPLLLSCNSFLTRIHMFHRLKWLLRPSGSPTAGDGFSRFMNQLASSFSGMKRDDIEHLFAVMLGDKTDTTAAEKPVIALAAQAIAFKPEVGSVIADAIKDLRQSLPDIPDASLKSGLTYLCKEIDADYRFPAQQALDQIKAVIAMTLRQDNVRGFVIGSSRSQAQIAPALSKVVERLDKTPSVRQMYASTETISKHLKDRTGEKGQSPFIGLVNENTRSGVFVNTAECASLDDTDPDKLLNFVSARLYGGGGAHSMFMKTWGAGLAYSNGLRSNEMNGRIYYYAERCPDLAQTMSFVVSELKKAPNDPSLADYAVSQAYALNRSGDTYEQRGESMASDLVDGLTPDKVRQFRTTIGELRKDPNFYDKIQSRMESVYGLVLPGYGPSAEAAVNAADALYFIIGPEKQFQSYETLLKQTEGDYKVERLYPSDFWITRPVPNDPGI